jgi:hypothetical protein
MEIARWCQSKDLNVGRPAAELLLNNFVESSAEISPRNRAKIALDPIRQSGVWIPKILRNKVKENDDGGSRCKTILPFLPETPG